ncbi:hypothetical protein PM082_011116 [Marasmius tenuissimus]|nr:hypothetical protein PM082_011116 [Marasmius tenuissimus]
MKIIGSRLQVRRDRDRHQVNLPPGPTPLEDVAEGSRKPKKRALLIGVRQTLGGLQPLGGPHKDVAAMKLLLIEKYQYDPKDIVVLVDTKDSKQKQPTHDNMLAEMKSLVRGAAPGDRFFFHYAGHAIQVDNEDNTEEDKMDECIVPCDATHHPDDPMLVKDDLLREILVDALPTGSHLVAIFDSCHSASLLDLKHFRCNRVYVPWMSKGRRKSDSIWRANVRRDAALVNFRTIHQTSRMDNNTVKTRKTSIDLLYEAPENNEHSLPSTPASHAVDFITESHNSDSTSTSTSVPTSSSRPQSISIVTNAISPNSRQRKLSRSNTRGRSRRSTSIYKSTFAPRSWFEDRPGDDDDDEPTVCESPIEQYCSGLCRDRSAPSPAVSRRPTWNGRSPVSAFRLPLGPPAEVISLSSCKDSQQSWEDLKGSSMTQTLVEILKTDPHPTLKDFMLNLSHDMHRKLLHIHSANKEYKKKKKRWRLKHCRTLSPRGDTNGAEISNFQDPQLSSHKPLDMNSRLVL